MRPVHVVLAVLIIVAAIWVSRPPSAQAQYVAPFPPAMLRHVMSDSGGNMVDADNGKVINGAVKGLSCVAPNDCWVAIQ